MISVKRLARILRTLDELHEAVNADAPRPLQINREINRLLAILRDPEPTYDIVSEGMTQERLEAFIGGKTDLSEVAQQIHAGAHKMRLDYLEKEQQ